MDPKKLKRPLVVGDRVKRTDHANGPVQPGYIGLVSRVADDGFMVQLDGDTVHWHSPSHLDLLSKEPTSLETSEREAVEPTFVVSVPQGLVAPPVRDHEATYAKLDPAVAKGSNPKDAIGATKLPLHLLSPIAKAYQAISLFLGNVKYGAWNYRAEGARASVYMAAAQRHLDKWWNGEEYDLADGTPHLANAMACLTILVEAKYAGKLTDDRPPRVDLNPLYKEMEDIMARIKKQYADKAPYHYTIADSQP